MINENQVPALIDISNISNLKGNSHKNTKDSYTALWESKIISQFTVSKMRKKHLRRLNNRVEISMNLSSTNISYLCKKYNFEEYARKNGNPKRPRIYWGTLFNHEFDLLEISLFEMIDIIYAFVVVEANSTFTGLPRKLRFPEAISRISNKRSRDGILLESKVVYHPWLMQSTNMFVSSNDTPMPNSTYYGREENMRNSLLRAWKVLGMRHNDIAIIADMDEFVSYDFLLALKYCNIFPNLKGKENDIEKLQKKRYPNLSFSEICLQNKILSRSNIFSSYFDCPAVAKYSDGSLYKGIRMNWHPDIILARCLLDTKRSSLTVENVRTKPFRGPGRLTRATVGWHYRNIMTPEDVLYKYQTYSHPNDSPIINRFNASVESMNLKHVLFEREEDCKHRYRIFLNETTFSVRNLPLLLQNESTRAHYRHLFYNYSDFSKMISP